MTRYMRSWLLLLSLVSASDAFVPPSRPTWFATAPSVPFRALMEVELEAEPEGGKELTPVKSIPGCRMKELEPAKADNTFKFWLTAQAEGELTKEIRTQILRDASRKADFPGFRKGQVPPYAQPQITQFAVQESIIKTVEASVEAFGLKSLPGSDGEVNVHEDVVELAKKYKTGDTIPFTATLNCEYDAAQTQDDGVVDVEATVEEEA